MTEMNPSASEGTEESAEAPAQPGQPSVDGGVSEGDSMEEERRSAELIEGSLVTLGFVSFDSGGAQNETAGLLVSPERRRHFRRDAYVGIKDEEQQLNFLGRVVQGPFYAPHEISADSAVSRTSLLHPERTRFRPVYYVHGELEILGQIVGDERIIPTPTRPRPYSEIYMYPADRLQKMLGLEGDFLIGHLMGYDEVDVRSDVESKNFLPRNVGIFGTVGSGKSNSTQVLIEEALNSGWAVVAIDVEGEYVRMDEPSSDPYLEEILREQYGQTPASVDDFQVFVPSAGTSDALAPRDFKVPMSQVQWEIVADIMDLTEPQQRMFGTITETASRQGSQGSGGRSRRGVLAQGAGTPSSGRPYTLQTLIDGLTPNNQGALPLLPQIQNNERPTAHVLRSKLMHFARSRMLDTNETSSVPELPIDELLVGGRLSILDVSETDDRSRNIAISYVLQSLFDQVIATPAGERMPNGQRRPKLLVVIEEVHTFVSRASAAKMRAVLDQLQVISRRGRKRWMGLVLVSQQPGHVPDELFELTNTRFIHQLKSSANLTPVRQTTGGVHEALWTTVPALGPGQCLLTGATFRNPIFVTVRPARSRRLLVA